ncbi:MAG: YifB family Mg chelatase-like AAA ATPase [Geminicoccaceae bacterium]
MAPSGPQARMAQVRTVAFQGIDVQPVEVQVQIGPGLPSFAIVGLPDKAVAESRERVRAALGAVGLSLPPKRITVNLAPADLQKEGSHYDLPIALGILIGTRALPEDMFENHVALGELGLDGSLRAVSGVLPAAVAASADDLALICPAACGGEAAWLADDLAILAAPDLLSLIEHGRGNRDLPRPQPFRASDGDRSLLDLKDIKGQETAKRALEIAAAGGHNLLLIGPPGAGKSMLAQRLPGLLPPLDPAEILEVSMIQSVAGLLKQGRLSQARPFRSPHHATSSAAMVGGGSQARPGEVSLAHKGVLFLDELPEFSRNVLEALRQPLETGEITVARAQVHATYPAQCQLIAAMNPCRCGHLDDPGQACARAPRCAQDYQARLSGPLMDRIDMTIEVPAVKPQDLELPAPAEDSAQVAARVAQARYNQAERFAEQGAKGVRLNARAEGQILDAITATDASARDLLRQAADRLGLSARGYYRVLRVARTIADLDGCSTITRPHVAEALSYRRRPPTRLAA